MLFCYRAFAKSRLLIKKNVVFYSRKSKMRDATNVVKVRDVFLGAVQAVTPSHMVRNNVELNGDTLQVAGREYAVKENVYMMGFGKAVLGMACEVEKVLKKHLQRGVVSVPLNIQDTLRDREDCALREDSVVRVLEGARDNLPDSQSLQASEQIISLVQELTETDLLIVLVSGGGSTLLTQPRPGISLEDKAYVTKLLASSGANIIELNTVRKKLSLTKGGGLAKMVYPTQMICLILSDVIDDRVDMIASGPTVPNTDDPMAAFDVIRKYKLELKIPKHVTEVLKGVEEPHDIPIKDNCFEHVDNVIIGSNKIMCARAVQVAESLGFHPVFFSSVIEGLVQELAVFYANLVFEICKVFVEPERNGAELEAMFRRSEFRVDAAALGGILNGARGGKQLCLIAGGETTVKLTGTGKGGRNMELAVWFSQRIHEMQSEPDSILDRFEILFLSAGTDGIDGPTDVAGAIGGPEVVALAHSKGLNVDSFLARNDTYNFYSSLEDGSLLVKTGHTGTNVMDAHLLVISPKS